jgi:hypothetical protein
VAEEFSVNMYAVGTGLTPQGIDLGSGNVQPVEMPEVALVIGDGVSAYEAGEAQFLLNMHLNMGVTRLAKDVLPRADLERYTTLILVDGSYGDWSDATRDKIRDWVRGGGVLIADEGAAEWAIRQKIVSENLIQSYSDSTDERVRYNYEERADRWRANTIPGVILEADIDPSHPIAFGAQDRSQLFIKDSNTFLKVSEDPYATVARYTSDPLRGGFVNRSNLDKIRGTAAIVAKSEGSGTVVLFSENPNFRSYWHTTSRLFINAILFGGNL